MKKLYEVGGIFILDIECETEREAREKGKKIFQDLGIEAYVTNTEKGEEN